MEIFLNSHGLEYPQYNRKTIQRQQQFWKSIFNEHLYVGNIPLLNAMQEDRNSTEPTILNSKKHFQNKYTILTQQTTRIAL
jgi:hypothetical protein